MACTKSRFVAQEIGRTKVGKSSKNYVNGLLNGTSIETVYNGEDIFGVKNFASIKTGDACDVYAHKGGRRFLYQDKNVLIISSGDYEQAHSRLGKHLVTLLAVIACMTLIWKNPWFHPLYGIRTEVETKKVK